MPIASSNFRYTFSASSLIQKVRKSFCWGSQDNNIGRTSLSEVLSIFFISIFQWLLPTYDTLSPFLPSYKSCETRPVWGARQFPALWHFCWRAFIFLNYFSKKEGFLKVMSYTWYIIGEIFHLNKYFVFYVFIKFNIVNCMKVTGETFSSYCKRKGAEEVRYQKHLNFQAKGLLPDRTLESFIQKGTDGAIPNF